mmetsp:Transcript_22790/g.26245  ORF Transcript_22790/g.26245 Transcript_22790/m.26245 type:complete len:780 (-) Transcript_22790:166-2505(-)
MVTVSASPNFKKFYKSKVYTKSAVDRTKDIFFWNKTDGQVQRENTMNIGSINVVSANPVPNYQDHRGAIVDINRNLDLDTKKKIDSNKVVPSQQQNDNISDIQEEEGRTDLASKQLSDDINTKHNPTLKQISNSNNESKKHEVHKNVPSINSNSRASIVPSHVAIHSCPLLNGLLAGPVPAEVSSRVTMKIPNSFSIVTCTIHKPGPIGLNLSIWSVKNPSNRNIHCKGKNICTVHSAIPGGQASLAGICSGDMFFNETSTGFLTIEKVMALIKNNPRPLSLKMRRGTESSVVNSEYAKRKEQIVQKQHLAIRLHEEQNRPYTKILHYQNEVDAGETKRRSNALNVNDEEAKKQRQSKKQKITNAEVVVIDDDSEVEESEREISVSNNHEYHTIKIDSLGKLGMTVTSSCSHGKEGSCSVLTISDGGKAKKAGLKKYDTFLVSDKGKNATLNKVVNRISNKLRPLTLYIKRILPSTQIIDRHKLTQSAITLNIEGKQEQKNKRHQQEHNQEPSLLLCNTTSNILPEGLYKRGLMLAIWHEQKTQIGISIYKIKKYMTSHIPQKIWKNDEFLNAVKNLISSRVILKAKNKIILRQPYANILEKSGNFIQTEFVKLASSLSSAVAVVDSSEGEEEKVDHNIEQQGNDHNIEEPTPTCEINSSESRLIRKQKFFTPEEKVSKVNDSSEGEDEKVECDVRQAKRDHNEDVPPSNKKKLLSESLLALEQDLVSAGEKRKRLNSKLKLVKVEYEECMKRVLEAEDWVMTSQRCFRNAEEEEFCDF